MRHLQVNLERLIKTIARSSEIGKIPCNGVRRLALTDEDNKMRDVFLSWMQEEKLETRVDDFGNMYGRLNGQSDLPPVLIGSHLDTQPNGGRFDGIVGVLSALEVIRTLNEQQIQTKRPIEIINFTNEEGARFEPPLLGSGGLTGEFSGDFVFQRKDRRGITFDDELKRIGYKGSKTNRIKDSHAFIELHIEQGPVLEKEGVYIGVVHGIMGMTWLEITVTGKGGHAGPTPMELRRDALMAVGHLLVNIEKKAKVFGQDTSVTVGRISAFPNVVNCIPEEVTFSLDVRNIKDEIREKFLDELFIELEKVCAQHQVELQFQKLWEVDTTHFDREIVHQIQKCANELDYSSKELYSGAGHDAKYMNNICPTGMIFIPSVNGISHVESELSLDKDIERGANALLHTVLSLANG